jgi:hypothetical protein
VIPFLFALLETCTLAVVSRPRGLGITKHCMIRAYTHIGYKPISPHIDTLSTGPGGRSCAVHSHLHVAQSSIKVLEKFCAYLVIRSAYSNNHTMPGVNTFLPPTVMREQQSQLNCMSPHRLDTARERIDAVCAEYNHFNPTCFVTESCSSTVSCSGVD